MISRNHKVESIRCPSESLFFGPIRTLEAAPNVNFMPHRCALPAAALAVLFGVAAGCPNLCNGNGVCITGTDYCKCFKNWMGGDCSQRACPFGAPKLDLPSLSFLLLRCSCLPCIKMIVYMFT
jgi:hypothetical protein